MAVLPSELWPVAGSLGSNRERTQTFTPQTPSPQPSLASLKTQIVLNLTSSPFFQKGCLWEKLAKSFYSLLLKFSSLKLPFGSIKFSLFSYFHLFVWKLYMLFLFCFMYLLQHKSSHMSGLKQQFIINSFASRDWGIETGKGSKTTSLTWLAICVGCWLGAWLRLLVGCLGSSLLVLSTLLLEIPHSMAAGFQERMFQ